MQSLSPPDLTFKKGVPPLTTSAAPRRKLLVVDDEEGPRKSICVVFKGDYTVLTAANGQQAITLAKTEHIDAAVLDICMEGMSGIELLEHLKALDPDIEVIMLTAYETLETARQALRLGACDYLDKPFDLATLRAAVAHAMDRRAVSESIRANNRKLEELKEEINRQQVQQEILRSKGQIYASILHDINNPLMIIIGYIEMIDQELTQHSSVGSGDLSTMRESLAMISEAVNHCQEISRRYLRFLREFPNEEVWTEVNPVLKMAEQLLRVRRPNAQCEVNAHLLEPDAQVRIHGTDLIQILVNLGVNALQCSPQGVRIDLTSQIRPEPLVLSQFVEGSQDRFLNREVFQNTAPLLAVSVIDTGPGIPAEVLPKLFTPNFTTKSDEQGHGLGLTIVLRLVKAAQGAIAVHTRPGQGTTFTIYLRAARPLPGDPAKPSGPSR